MRLQSCRAVVAVWLAADWGWFGRQLLAKAHNAHWNGVPDQYYGTVIVGWNQSCWNGFVCIASRRTATVAYLDSYLLACNTVLVLCLGGMMSGVSTPTMMPSSTGLVGPPSTGGGFMDMPANQPQGGPSDAAGEWQWKHCMLCCILVYGSSQFSVCLPVACLQKSLCRCMQHLSAQQPICELCIICILCNSLQQPHRSCVTLAYNIDSSLFDMPRGWRLSTLQALASKGTLVTCRKTLQTGSSTFRSSSAGSCSCGTVRNVSRARTSASSVAAVK